MTGSSTASRQGLRGQLNKLRNLAQPFFLPLDQAVRIHQLKIQPRGQGGADGALAATRHTNQ